MFRLILATLREDFHHALLPVTRMRREGLHGFIAGLKAGFPASLFSIPLIFLFVQGVLILLWALSQALYD